MNDLDKRQIKWQDWRSDLYSRYSEAGREESKLNRANKYRLEHAAQSTHPQYHAEKFISEAESATTAASKLEEQYNVAVTLDTALKNARYNLNHGGSEADYITALEACEEFMQTKP